MKIKTFLKICLVAFLWFFGSVAHAYCVPDAYTPGSDFGEYYSCLQSEWQAQQNARNKAAEALANKQFGKGSGPECKTLEEYKKIYFFPSRHDEQWAVYELDARFAMPGFRKNDDGTWEQSFVLAGDGDARNRMLLLQTRGIALFGFEGTSRFLVVETKNQTGEVAHGIIFAVTKGEITKCSFRPVYEVEFSMPVGHSF